MKRFGFFALAAALTACDQDAMVGNQNDDGGVSSDDAMVNGLRVFITSTDYTGNFGGWSGADEKCQLTADARSFGGTWRAWVSDGASSAINRISGDGPWVSLSGEVIFSNRAALQTLPNNGFMRIKHEDGSIAVGEYIWTGTIVGGTPASEHCDSWTNESQYMTGRLGRLDSGRDAAWTDLQDLRCDQRQHLLCLEVVAQ